MPERTSANNNNNDNDNDNLNDNENENAKKQSFYTSMLVELWLWMQFAVILAVFVVTMARMGPKSVIRGPALARTQKGPGGK